MTGAITVEADGQPVGLRTIIFSGGEVQPRLLDGPAKPWAVKITAYIWSAEDLMELMLVDNAVHHRWPEAARYLVMPYIPYARQDRVCYDGEAFGLDVIASMVNSCAFAGVEVWDPHSEKSLLIERLRIREAKEFVAKIPILTNDTVIIAPDEGAYRRAWACSCIHPRMDPLFTGKTDNFIVASKSRSSDTGELQPPIVNDGHLIKGRDCLIVDDICDGGRTFANLAKVLRPLTAGRIHLYVTHGIFANGLLEMMGNGIEHFYVANPHPGAREYVKTGRFTILT